MTTRIPTWQKVLLAIVILLALIVIAGLIPISSGGSVING
jgi:hypothetical protein